MSTGTAMKHMNLQRLLRNLIKPSGIFQLRALLVHLITRLYMVYCSGKFVYLIVFVSYYLYCLECLDILCLVNQLSG